MAACDWSKAGKNRKPCVKEAEPETSGAFTYHEKSMRFCYYHMIRTGMNLARDPRVRKTFTVGGTRVGA